MAAKNTIRFLKTAKISFSSFDNRATGACEFYRQMTAGKTRAVNPKADVTYTTTLFGTQPIIKLDFSACGRVLVYMLVLNGSKQTLEVPGKNVREIFDEVDFFCSQIETEYEQAGKIID